MGVIFEEVTAEIAPPRQREEEMPEREEAPPSDAADSRRWRRELALWQRRSRRLEAD